jgi:hypothetical protein
MDAVIGWPFRIFLSLCGGIAAWFVDQGSVNFIMIQMAVAILVVTLIVLIATYWRYAVAFLGRRH